MPENCNPSDCPMRPRIEALDVANEHFPWPLPLWVQAILGGLAITAGELAAGLVLNVWLGLDIWDYSGQWSNLWGQICPLYTGLWCLLAGPVIVGFDWLDHWLCGGERPRYTILRWRDRKWSARKLR